MKPVMQSKLYQADAPMRGNGHAAALASLLEIPLWMVPAFEDMDYQRKTEREPEWLRRFFGLRLVKTRQHDVDVLPEFYIACGPSPRGTDADPIYHSVIYSRGALVHDPHPSGSGVRAVEWTWHLEHIEPVMGITGADVEEPA